MLQERTCPKRRPKCRPLSSLHSCSPLRLSVDLPISVSRPNRQWKFAAPPKEQTSVGAQATPLTPVCGVRSKGEHVTKTPSKHVKANSLRKPRPARRIKCRHRLSLRTYIGSARPGPIVSRLTDRRSQNWMEIPGTLRMDSSRP